MRTIFRLKEHDDGVIVEVYVKDRYLQFLGPFSDEKGLKEKISLIKKDLEYILEEAKKIFKERAVFKDDLQGLEIEQIWKILSEIKDEKKFIDSFNKLDEEVRRKIADFVFSRCNVFSGNASVFSLKYNRDSALLE